MPTEMSSINIALTGIEATQLFLEPVFMDDDILSNFRLMPNVVSKKKMAFAEKLEKIVRKYSGCGFEPVDGFAMYERSVEVELVKADLSFCIDEFLNTAFEELLSQGTSINDLNGTVIAQVILERYRQAIKKDIMRLYFFGDTTSLDVEYDAIDGLWTRWIQTLVTNNLVPYYNTTSGVALNANDGIDILTTVYDNAPNELMAIPNRRFYVSGTVYRRYLEDLDSAALDSAWAAMQDGIPQVRFRSVPVVPMWEWNEIQDELGSPLSHLCLYTTPDNLVLATDLANPGSDFRVWFEEKDDKWNIKGRMKFGGNYVHHQLMSVGY